MSLISDLKSTCLVLPFCSEEHQKMSFLSSFRKLFRFGGEDDAKSKKKELFKNIKRDVDPKNLWDILSEIGDGAFGKVYKVRCSHCKILVNFDRCVKNHRHRHSPQMHP